MSQTKTYRIFVGRNGRADHPEHEIYKIALLAKAALGGCTIERAWGVVEGIDHPIPTIIVTVWSSDRRHVVNLAAQLCALMDQERVGIEEPGGNVLRVTDKGTVP